MGEQLVSWELLPSDVMAAGSGLCVNPSPMVPLATRSSALFIQPVMRWGKKQNIEKETPRFKTFSDHKEHLLNLPWSGKHMDRAVFFKELDLKAGMEINGDPLEAQWRSHSGWWINVVPMVHSAIVILPLANNAVLWSVELPFCVYECSSHPTQIVHNPLS